MTDREEYEKKFPVPPAAFWVEIAGQYWPKYEDNRCKVISDQYQYGWEVWQAARTGGEVEPVGYGIHSAQTAFQPGDEVVDLEEAETYMPECVTPLYTHPAPSSKAEPSIIDDESPARKVGELGNMLHNLSCEHQNNEQLSERLGTLSSEAWDISKSLSPRAPAAAVPDGWDGEAYAKMSDEIHYWKNRALEADAIIEKVRDDLSPTQMGEPVIQETVYRWRALDYTGYCYGARPPKNLPKSSELTAFYKLTAAPQPVGESEKDSNPDHSKLIFVGFTNPYQIHYAKDESGSFYRDTDNECYIPLYMLKIHKHRLGDIEPLGMAAQPPEGEL